jgi:hypothetical protein
MAKAMVTVSSSFLLTVAAACCSSVEMLDLVPVMVRKMVVVGVVVDDGEP